MEILQRLSNTSSDDPQGQSPPFEVKDISRESARLRMRQWQMMWMGVLGHQSVMGDVWDVGDGILIRAFVNVVKWSNWELSRGFEWASNHWSSPSYRQHNNRRNFPRSRQIEHSFKPVAFTTANLNLKWSEHSRLRRRYILLDWLPMSFWLDHKQNKHPHHQQDQQQNNPSFRPFPLIPTRNFQFLICSFHIHSHPLHIIIYPV